MKWAFTLRLFQLMIMKKRLTLIFMTLDEDWVSFPLTKVALYANVAHCPNFLDWTVPLPH